MPKQIIQKYRFCIRLQFCYLAMLGFTQNWLVDIEVTKDSLVFQFLFIDFRSQGFALLTQFCYLATLGFTQNWLVDWHRKMGECLNRLFKNIGFAFASSFATSQCSASRKTG